jgi:prophage regulatory protein
MLRDLLDAYAAVIAKHGKESPEAKEAWKRVDAFLTEARSQGESPILLSRQQVEQRYAISTTSLYREVRAGRFPTPVRISGNRVAWVESECESWLAARIADRKRPREQRLSVKRSLEARARKEAPP